MDKKCKVHRKYKGKRKPKYQCETCLSFYLTLKSPRFLPMPTKVIPNKRKYNRKRNKGIEHE